jgi:hypothetical protein
MPRPVAVNADTTDIPGVPGRLVAPLGLIQSITPTVLINNKPALTIGAIVPTHGNPYNPKAPGFNPPCASSTIVSNAVPSILVEGKPLAVIGPPGSGSVCACGHVVIGPGAPNVLAGP